MDKGADAGAGPARKGSNASVISTSSLKSKSSKASLISKASSASLALKKGFTLKFGARSSVATTASVAEVVNFSEGDQIEVLSLVTLRKDESLDSTIVWEIPNGTTLQVLEVGAGRRIKVKVLSGDGQEGWISSKTKLNEPLVMKRGAHVDLMTDGFEKGGHHEIKSIVTVREEEGLDSEVKTELQPGTVIKILEVGTANSRRAKVSVNGELEGWISLATKQGEVLIGKVSEPNQDKKANLTSNSDKVKNMLEAARSNKLEDLKKIVEGGAGIISKFASRPNLNSADIRGKTPLIYASAFGNKEVVEYLLTKTKEINVDALDDTQKSALHHASKRAAARRSGGMQSGQAEIVQMLITAGAHIEVRDHHGCTPLMFAVANGDEAVLRVLLEAKAHVNVRDFEGHRPLDYAKEFKHSAMISMLKDYGAEGESDEDADATAAEESPKAGEPADPAEDKPAAEAEVAEAADAAEAAEAPPSQDGKAQSAKPKKKAKAKAAAPEPENAEADGDAKKKGKKKVAPEKAKAKTKAKAVRRTSAVGIMAAAGAAEDPQQEVTVEVVTEEIDAKQRAVNKLEALMKSKCTAEELSAGIQVAQAAGAEEADCAQADAMLKEIKAQNKASADLRQAMVERTVAGLHEAISRAEEVKLPAAEIEEAKKVLEEEKPKEEARKKLKAAQDGGDSQSLKKALVEAKAAKIDAAELAEFEELLAGAESKDKAEAALKSAVAERNVAALKFAIQQAKDAGVDQGAITNAEAVLKEEEPKQRAREALAEAYEKPTIPGLEAAIEGAKKVGLEASEFSEAESMLKQEVEKQARLGAVRQVLQENSSVDMTSVDTVRAAKEKIHAAIKEAIAAGVAEVDLYEAEVRRKRLHNTIEDLKGSIRVYCRIRPLSTKEKNQGDTGITKQVDLQTIEVGKNQFQFDSVWTPGTQEEVFEDCKDLIQSAADGYNVTMFAYGQTGAGKTFTMAGVPGNEGVSLRTIQEIFRVTKANESRCNYTIMGSMLELYRNDLVDLLAKGDPKATKSKLNVRQEKSGMVIVEHLTEEECQDAEELASLLKRGNDQRTVAATAMNSESSRSHLVLVIHIISVNKETKAQLRGKILICDLAGSERLKKSQVTADMQKEAIEINKSLTALGDVIEALTKNSKMIPYRNHKLTQLMQDSLGGSAKTLMFVNCSPANSNEDETLMALKYAQRAKKITNTKKG